MKKTFIVITCQRALKTLGSAPRPYGYTLKIDPPEEDTIEGHEVEGIGWVYYIPPKKVVHKWHGWYKHKSDAIRRANELNA